MKYKKLIFGVVFTVLLILLFNMLWFLNYKRFKCLTLDYEFANGIYIKSNEKYTFSVSPPRYPKFVGNYSISYNDTSVGLIIWPSLTFGYNYEFGLIIYNEDLTQGYQVYVDQNLNYDDISNEIYTVEQSKIIKQLMQHKRIVLEEMSKLADKEWNINKSIMEHN